MLPLVFLRGIFSSENVYGFPRFACECARMCASARVCAWGASMLMRIQPRSACSILKLLQATRILLLHVLYVLLLLLLALLAVGGVMVARAAVVILVHVVTVAVMGHCCSFLLLHQE